MQIFPSIYPLVRRPRSRPVSPTSAPQVDGLPLVLTLPDPVDVVTMFSIEGLLTGHTLVDRYEVGAVLGRGGMGVVYRARDLKLDREVALKVLTLASADPEDHAQLRRRLAREARTAAGIKHPNVVAVYDHATDESLGLDFLTMELLEGEDLATRLRRVGLPRLRSAVTVIRETAAGLAAGHRAGLVHRDVKPGNIFLEDGSDRGPSTVKVLDFGIAEGEFGADSTLTRADVGMAGALSPAFASPEQLRGGEWLTPASDVFSLGAVAYNLLTGKRVFDSLDGEQTLREVEESLARLREEQSLPSKLLGVLEKALAPFPEERFPDAGSFLRALDGLGDPELGPAHTSVEMQPVEAATLDEDLSDHPFAPAVARAHLEHPLEPYRTTEIARQRALNAAGLVLLLGCWAFGAGGLLGPRGSVIAALAVSAVLAPWLVFRLNGQRGSLRFVFLATVAITVIALALVGGSLPTLGAFAGIGAAQLAIACVASWLSAAPADVVDAEYEIVSARTDAW